ncbi:MAG TPA: hypothetical protein VHC43_05440 [Mycobacteriales bacterium]|nr:hypothetical protein [Mycobacteriales bacterium]
MRHIFVIARLAACLALAIALAGCSGSSTGLHGEHTSPDASAPPAMQAAANRAAANVEARRLMSLVRVPAGARRIHKAPPNLGEAVGTPAVSSLAHDHAYWSIPMSYDEAVRWFMNHRPKGHLTSDGSGAGSGPGFRTSGIEYRGRRNPAFQSSELSINVGTESAGRSYMRADAEVVWLDPRPIRDTEPGPRIHFTVANGCPDSDKGLPDVSNRRPGLGAALLPDQNPERALLCRYAGGNGPAFHLISHRLLDARAATQAMLRVRALPLSHVDGGVQGCPADDGSAGYIAFEYTRGFNVDLKVGIFGCTSVTNGVILAEAGNVPRLFSKLGPKTPF